MLLTDTFLFIDLRNVYESIIAFNHYPIMILLN